MNRLVPVVLFSAAFGMPLAPAMAQEGKSAPAAKGMDTSAVDPAAKEFIDTFRANVKKVDDISCTVTQSMVTGDEKTSQTGDIIATLQRRPNGGAMLKMFKISTKHDDVDGVWAFDGKTAYKIDRAKKTFASMETEKGPGAVPVQDISMVIPTWIYGSDILSNKDAKLTGAKFLPDATTDGVKCRVVQYQVEVVFPDAPDEDGDTSKDKKHEPLKMTMKQTRHVGAEDLISRTIESATSYTGGAEEPPAKRTFTASYTNVKVNTKPAPEAFALKAPTGFATAKADAEDLGIPSDERPKLKFAEGDAAPAFALKTPDGAEVTLASLKGRVVLLDFWATWCGPCKMAMPGVQKISEKYKGKKVSVFGIDTFEHGPAEKAKKYMDDKGYTYGLLYSGDALAKQYGISGIPTFVLIGQDGKIIHLGVGFDEGMDEHLSEMIDKALGGA